MRFLDAVGLAKLRNLRLGFRGRAEGYLSGRHHSAQFGFSQEFAHHRQYVPGDELKFLDWKVYARKDRYFVKQFQEDVSLQTYLLVDVSGSMGFTGDSARSTKWEYACKLAVSLAYLTIRQSDAAGLIPFSARPGAPLPPRSQMTHLELIDSTLAASAPKGETKLDSSLRQVFGLISRRSRIVLISDLLGDPVRVLEVVRALRARKNEVLVIQVLDPAERELPYEGPVRFESMENEDWLRCEVPMVRAAYREEFERMLGIYRSGFHQSAVPYMCAFTDFAWDAVLGDFLATLEKAR